MRNLLFAIILILPGIGHAQMVVGDKLPEISLKNDKAQSISLSDFKDKILLVDFWTSWCGPCRAANKKMVRLYNETKDKGFEIVGISLDTDQKKWLSAIEKDNLKYTQLIDPKGFDAKSALLFNVESMPATYLFDRSGKLLAINPSEQQILNAINN